MPRTVRKGSKTGIYHIMFRGINKQCIFQDDEDRSIFLNRLQRFKYESDFELYAYCLMSNHVHLLIKETSEPISSIIKRIGVSYVYWFNKKYERTGHLFQDRYKSEPIENDSYLLAAARYIHQNPMQVGLTIDSWTSYSDYYRNSGITDKLFILDLFNKNRMLALDLFAKYMNEKNSDKCLELFDRKIISDKEAEAIVKKLGNVMFCQDIQKLDKIERDKILCKIKCEGISIRQLARLTGLNRGVILNA